jgi:hypothetical protein
VALRLFQYLILCLMLPCLAAAGPDIFDPGPEGPLDLSATAEYDSSGEPSGAHGASPFEITPVPTVQPQGWVYYQAGEGEEPSELLEIWNVDAVSFEFRLSHWTGKDKACEVAGVAGRKGDLYVWRRIFGKVPGKIVFELKGKQAIEVQAGPGVREQACPGGNNLRGGLYRFQGPQIAPQKDKS